MRRCIGALLVIAPLLLVAGGAVWTAPSGTINWNLTRFAGNPVISTADNPDEPLEQYTPAPIRLANGDIWVYVKGQYSIYAWKSTDDGETFTLENGGDPVILPETGEWDQNFAVDPAVVYDAASNTIHLWYKGTDVVAANADWAWGHATAADSDPTTFTKDVGNPILTSTTALTDLGGAAITDFSLSDVIKDGTTYHFYGYARVDGRYQLVTATGTDWDNPSSVTSLLLADTDSHVVGGPTVFQLPGEDGYRMFYSWGLSGSSGSRSLRAATSDDLSAWDFSDTAAILSPASGWESLRAHAASLLKETAAPYVAPIIDGSNRWKLYYSGQSGGVADTGLAYLEPE